MARIAIVISPDRGSRFCGNCSHAIWDMVAFERNHCGLAARVGWKRRNFRLNKQGTMPRLKECLAAEVGTDKGAEAPKETA